MLKSYLVTGGGGYLGHKLGTSLCSDGADVRLFDCTFSCTDEVSSQSGARGKLSTVKVGNCGDFVKILVNDLETLIQGDVSNLDDVVRACKDVDCVMHVASYGMSGRDMVTLAS